MADRLLGSPSIYAARGREAEESINFVACHDGFTLNDLVTYNQKHNQENGEDNRDGHGDNRSWNCGCEGPTNDAEIEKLRNRQVKNVLTTTMFSVGVPMFVMGDEVRRSQRGNNNAYCQDNDTSWFDWALLSKHADMHRFVKLLIDRRLIRDVEHERRRTSLAKVLRDSKEALHGVKLNQPDCSRFSHSFAISGELKNESLFVHAMFNAYWESLDFELPVLEDRTMNWFRWIDTALDPPHEICEWNGETRVRESIYRVGARSVVVLIAGDGVNGHDGASTILEGIHDPC
jgi:glycogen operon protein